MNHQFTAPERFRSELQEALLEHAAMRPGAGPLSAAGPGPERHRAGPRISRRRVLSALALAAVVGAAALILRSGGVVAPQPATAAEVLRASAAALSRHGGPRALGPGDYFYTRTMEWWNEAGFGPHPYIVRSLQEEWLARDGHGRSRYVVVGLSGRGANRSLPFARSQDARLGRSARPFILSTLPTPGIVLSYAQLRRLPTNPARLDVALNHIAASYHVSRLFPRLTYGTVIRFAILRGLAEAPSSAALRAALFRVLAATPGIRLLGPARDSIGRWGVAVAVDAEDVQLEMILDPATGELLQTSRTLLHRSRLYLDGKQPPGLLNRATFVATGVVQSTQDRVP
jgi:hypothetical protein